MIHSLSRIRPWRRIVIASTFGAMLSAAFAVPPDIFFLEPDNARPALGGRVGLNLLAIAANEDDLAADARGVAGRLVPFNARALDWKRDTPARLFIHRDGHAENRERSELQNAPGAPRVLPAAAGVVSAGAEWEPRLDTLTAVELLAFIDTSLNADAPGVSAIRDELRRRPADAPLRVLRVSAARALLRTVNAEDNAGGALAVSKAGQPAELRPMFDPTRIRLASDLPIKFYLDYSKLEAVRVSATHRDGTRVTALADATGLAILRLTKLGAYRVEAHHLDREAGDRADFRLATATLTFTTDGEVRE